LQPIVRNNPWNTVYDWFCALTAEDMIRDKYIGKAIRTG